MINELFEPETWGLHDATLVSMWVDWTAHTFEFDVRVRLGERAERDRLARVVCSGLAFFAIDSAQVIEWREKGLWIDGEDGVASRAPANPTLPEDCTPAWLYVHEWNGFIRFAARAATWSWLEPLDRPLG